MDNYNDPKNVILNITNVATVLKLGDFDLVKFV